MFVMMSDDTQQLLRKRRLPNMSPFAWLLLPLLAVVVTLIVLFDDSETPRTEPLEIVEQSAEGAMVHLAGPVSLVWDEALRIDQLRLEIRGAARFAENGEALFQAAELAAPSSVQKAAIGLGMPE